MASIRKLFDNKNEKIKQYDIEYEELKDIFCSKIIDNVPFFAGRLGLTETYNLRTFENHNIFRYKKAMSQLCQWSGFFPNEVNLLKKYCGLMQDSMQCVDYIHPFWSEGEEYLIKKYCKADVKLTANPTCWASEDPFTKALEGKKVLVIHPFAESIEKQYLNRDKLFPKIPNMLPEFELHTLKAVQTLAGEEDNRFRDWFEALDWMCQETQKIDYDVALIGCGAYGFPLGAFCKKQGKIAIHMGGDLQLQFGILGARWDEHPWVKENANEYWIRPCESERPKNAKDVESECYW